MTVEEAMNGLKSADVNWREKLANHQRAEPNAGYAERLRETAVAAAQEQAACLKIADEGLRFDPPPADKIQPLPYELQRRSGRVGPPELWARFDAIHDAWMSAWLNPDPRVIAAAFGDLAAILGEIATAVDVERGQPVKPGHQRRSA